MNDNMVEENTPVEWLINQIKNNLGKILINHDFRLMNDLFNQAKEIELNQKEKNILEFINNIENKNENNDWIIDAFNTYCRDTNLGGGR